MFSKNFIIVLDKEASSIGMAKLEAIIKSYFNFSFVYASVIALLIFGGIYLFLRRCHARQKLPAKAQIVGIVLAVYLAFLIGGTLLNRKIGGARDMELTLFWSYREYFTEKSTPLLKQMIYNVLVFVPWTILFSVLFPAMRKFRWAVGSAFLFSVFIEVTQLVFRLGLFEFDDIFHNVMGAVIGFFIWMICRKHAQKIVVVK